MAKFDQTSAEVLVFTFNEGMLAAMGHDLKLRVTRFEIVVDDAKTALTAKFDARSLRVVAAMRDGREQAGALSAADTAKIEQSIVDDVLLDRGRFAEIVFQSTHIEALPSGGHRVEGKLTIRGAERPVQFVTRVDGGREEAEVALHQPDYGIKPFRAAFGALRVKPEVRIQGTILGIRFLTKGET